MCALPRVFIRNVDIFLSDYFRPIFESYSEMNIIEGNRDDTSLYIEHIRKGINGTFKVSCDINQSGKEDISNFISSNHSWFIKLIFEQLSNHFCIFCEGNNSTSNVSWRKNSKLISDSSGCSSIISDWYYSGNIIFFISFETSKYIKSSSSSSNCGNVKSHRFDYVSNSGTIILFYSINQSFLCLDFEHSSC